MLTPEEVSLLHPVGAIIWYEDTKTAEVLRCSPPKGGGSLRPQTGRGKVKELSRKSMNRLLFLAQTTSVTFLSMVTLTYLCPPPSGKQAKRHLKDVLQWIKRRKGKGCEHLWFAEFTKAGHVHFHILLCCNPTIDDRRDLAYYWLKKTTQGYGEYCRIKDRRKLRVGAAIFSSMSHPKVWEDLRKQDGGKRYVAKYAGKTYQKQIPWYFQDMGRFWGASRAVWDNRLEHKAIALTEDELREVLREQGHPAANWDVLPRYLWNVDEINL